MKYFSIKMKSWAAIAAIFAAFFFAPVTAIAETGQELVATINAYGTGGGTGGALQAVWDAESSTVTITNTGNVPISDASETLMLDIDQDVRVIWIACLEGNASGFEYPLVHVIAGDFEVAGGKMSSAWAAIFAEGTNSMITVSAGELTGINGGSAIETSGHVNITGGTLRSSGDGVVIYADGEVSTINVNGGTVSNSGGVTIYTDGESSTITVSGGEVNISNGNAIVSIGVNSTIVVSGTGEVKAVGDNNLPVIGTYGNVNITGGTVSASGCNAIQAQGENSVITVSGGTVSSISRSALFTNGVNSSVNVSGGEVSSKGELAIYTAGDLNISGGTITRPNDWVIRVSGESSKVTVSGGTVNAPDGTALVVEGANSTVTVSDGTLNATGGSWGILARGANSTVTVNGGTVSTVAGTAIVAEGINSTVTVSGTGDVKATNTANNNDGWAIRCAGNVDVSGGTVSATRGCAIYATGVSSTVAVSAGSVTTIGGYTIYAEGANSTVTVSGTGEVRNETQLTIFAGGNVNITGGTVSSPTDWSIEANGVNSKVTVSDGIVSTNSGVAIAAVGTNSKILVNGGTVSGAPNGTAIYATGASSIVNVSSGTVSSIKNYAIYAEGINCTVNISDTGEVKSSDADNPDSWTLSCAGNVNITGGTVSSIGGRAINATGANSEIIVSGGTVSAVTGYAISTDGANSTVTVSGTGEVKSSNDDSTDGISINASGNVNITGGTVSATSGVAIVRNGKSSTTAAIVNKGVSKSIFETNSNLKVRKSNLNLNAMSEIAVNTLSGITNYIDNKDGTVNIERKDIGEGGSITVSGGIVSTVTAVAIYVLEESTTVTVSGGEVKATFDEVYSGSAIESVGKVNIIGGTVSAVSGVGIKVDGENSMLTVNGGVVKATDNVSGSITYIGRAIENEGKVIINDGAVSAEKGMTIRTKGENGVIFINGGRVTIGAGTLIELNGDNPLIIERIGTATIYTAGSSTGLNVQPASQTTAVWAIENRQHGVNYARNTNTGFLQAAGITVTTEEAKSISVGVQNGTLITGTVGTAVFDITTTNFANETYPLTLNGAPEGVTATNVIIADNSGTLTISMTDAVAANTYSLTISIGGVTSAAFTLTVDQASVTPQAPTITGTTTMTLQTGYAATSTETYAITGTEPVTVTKTSGNDAIAWNDDAKRLDIATGLAAGTYPVVLTASNGVNPDATLTFTLMVTDEPVAPEPPVITTTTLPDGATETAYSQNLAATGDEPIMWELESGDLPNGLNLAESGAISGTPTTEGTFNFTVKATNTAGSATQALTIVISAAATPPVITMETLPGGTTGEAYSQTLTATGTAPFAWELESGDLPNGLNLAENGAISGTPTTAGTFNFTVKATNAAGSATKALTIVISADSVTGSDEIPFANPLKAWTRNGLLHVTGLTVGEPLSVYTATGTRVYHNVVTSDETDITLDIQGIYIVKQSKNTIKVVF